MSIILNRDVIAVDTIDARIEIKVLIRCFDFTQTCWIVYLSKGKLF
jgi:hypothetical protein